jgi:hypothetical protein|tara:strand:- start:24 stop:335 length:312 start_codon:yes stop_codon:yes gene_type:complete
MKEYMYLVQMDIPTELESEFNRIYDTQHIPNILNVEGVSSCVRYKLVSSDVEGTAQYAAVYIVSDPNIPFSTEWTRESDKGDWSMDIRPSTVNRSHIVFEKLP